MPILYGPLVLTKNGVEANKFVKPKTLKSRKRRSRRARR